MFINQESVFVTAHGYHEGQTILSINESVQQILSYRKIIDVKHKRALLMAHCIRKVWCRPHRIPNFPEDRVPATSDALALTP